MPVELASIAMSRDSSVPPVEAVPAEAGASGTGRMGVTLEMASMFMRIQWQSIGRGYVRENIPADVNGRGQVVGAPPRLCRIQWNVRLKEEAAEAIYRFKLKG